MTDFQNEISAFLNNYNSNAVAIFNEDFDKDTLPPNVKMKEEDNYGGEGQGESYWRVNSFEKDGEKLYVKFDGSYYSYDGSTYDSWFFVEPREVIVTQYVRID